MADRAGDYGTSVSPGARNAVTVVVVTYNSADVVSGLLDSLGPALAGAGAHELVVVDNASTDATLDLVARIAPQATVVPSATNAGYAAGLNAALRHAAPSEAVLLLNPDVRLEPGAVAELQTVMARSGAGIIVPRITDPEGRLVCSLRREPAVLRALGEALLGGRLAGRVDRLGEVVTAPGAYDRPTVADWASGAAMLISADCLDAVGPWDESFFLYSEETDFALRARDLGFHLRLAPRAGAVHIGGESSTSARLWSLLTLNRVRLFARRNGRIRTEAFRAAVAANEAIRTVRRRGTHRSALAALARPGTGGHAAVVERARGTERGRVLIIVQNLPVPFDRRVWRESLALVEAGFHVSVIAPKGPEEVAHEVLEGVSIYRYPAPPQGDGLAGYVSEFVYCWLATAGLSVKVLLREGFDVIQACNPPDTYWALAALYKPFGKRFVFDQHDLCPEVYQSRFGRDRGLLLAGLRWLERCTYRVADHVIATNESYRRIALDRGGKSPDEVTVVRNGPDPERMRPGSPDPSVKAGKSHLCVYLGVMGPQDGVDLVLRAADVIVHEMGRTDVHFALLGFGDCLDDLRQLARDLDLVDHVTFTGRADDEMISRYLSTADVALSPDPKDPFNDASTMNKTMEYMAFALPVVAFDLTETRFSAQDAAVYVDGNDASSYAKAVVELLEDPDRRAGMGTTGRSRVESRLSWQTQTGGYLDVYRRLTPPS